MITLIIIIVGAFLLSLLSYLIIMTIKEYAKKDKHFTTLGNEEGKLIAQEQNIVNVISNMQGMHYNELGELIRTTNPNKYGSLFKELGVIYFGISPIKRVYQFSLSWSEFVEREAREVRGEPQPIYEIVNKRETLTTFKRLYSHAILVPRIELKDGSKVDMVYIVTFEILNIIQVIFKVKPDGIILAQAEAAFGSALQDELRIFDYVELRDTVDKSSRTSPLVIAVIAKTNDIIEEKFHLRADLMEMKIFDLSRGEPGDEEILKATKAKEIATLQGDAKITAATKDKEAQKLRGEGEKEYFDQIALAIGAENIAQFAIMEQIKGSNLVSYGSGSTPVVPMVNVKPTNTKTDQDV